MNFWTIGDFEFDANTRRVRGPNSDALLEPKPAALLAYLCENPNRSIGRDELLQTVWHGQVVSDNSINRIIVLLRKALQDEEKPRRYISTIPKVGYRMIAEVSVLHTLGGAAETSRHIVSRSSVLRNSVVAVAALALILLIAVVMQGPLGSGDQQRPSIAPLSRLAVTQSNAALAKSDQTLLYTASEGAWSAIYQVSETGTQAIPISEPGGDADFASWAQGDDFLVYLFRTAQRCEFHRIERDEIGTRVAQPIYECLPGSFTELALAPDNSTLYFVERPHSAAPYTVYALDLDGHAKRRLSQPLARGYGNHFVDAHPQKDKLLALADRVPGKTSVYELDTETDSFKLLHTFNYSLDSAIWSHRDGYIVHPSRHPSYQLLETSLETGVSEVIVSDSRRISGPRRITTGDGAREYLFTSYLYNRDIQFDGHPAAQFNSAVMDYLPAISHSGDRVAFVSKRSGNSQIWIWDFGAESLSTIKPPDSGRRFLNLSWSQDDQQLLANTNSGILVYSLLEDAFVEELTLSLPAYAVRWHDAKTLSFSHYEDQRWRAYLYHLDSAKPEALDERWAFTLRNQWQYLHVDQALNVYRDGVELPDLQACSHPLWRAQLRYQLDQRNIYCHADDAAGDLLRFDADMNKTRLTGIVSRYEFFSVRDGKLATTQVASSYSDIMRTRRSG